jgi:hypothetical protein
MTDEEHVRHKLVNKGGRIFCSECPLDVPEPQDTDAEVEDDDDRWWWAKQW